MEKLTIVISGLPGSGSSTISKLLAHKLNLDYFGAGRLFKDISKGTYKEQYYFKEFNKLCLQRNLLIPQLKAKDDSTAAYNLWNTEFGKSKKLNNIIDKLQEDLGKKGNIVIDGKIAIFIVKNATLKIWFKADFDIRAIRTKQRDDISLEKAKEFLSKREEIEKLELNKIYNFNLLDQEKIADLVIDTTKISSEEILNIILKKLKNISNTNQ